MNKFLDSYLNYEYLEANLHVTTPLCPINIKNHHRDMGIEQQDHE